MIRTGSGWRSPLAVQVGLVVVLVAAAVATLWSAGTSVVRREVRRAAANDRLKRASDLLDAQSRDDIAGIRPYQEFMEPGEWAAVDAGLAAAVRRLGEEFPGVEGGYYVPGHPDGPFLPALPGGRSGRSLYDDVETQVDAAYRKRSDLSVVEDVPPDTVAIRATPVRVGDRVVGAAWTMVRLVDPIYLDSPGAGFRWFAGLSLAGLALSLGLSANLARTIRRQAAERSRLQLELRRSERLAALGRLLAGVAHEVRNPLAGIRSTAQLWQRGVGIGPDLLDGLVHEVDRLDGIVSRLLQFSRADAQDLAPGDLNAVLADAARLAEAPAGAKGIRVELDLTPDLPPVVLAAPALLQVFRNLTANAIQAMEPGGTLTIRSRRDPSGRAVEAAVWDTGPGLSDEGVDHLFEPFYTTKPEGTGLGLAIAREIALAHRGEIRAGGRPDHAPGAAFTIRLPAADAGPEGAARR